MHSQAADYKTLGIRDFSGCSVCLQSQVYVYIFTCQFCWDVPTSLWMLNVVYLFPGQVTEVSSASSDQWCLLMKCGSILKTHFICESNRTTKDRMLIR